MNISIDLRDQTPVYEQLVASIKEMMNRGDLVPGDPLPTVRQLGQDLGVNLNTVARAYRQLAQHGVLSVRQGRGVSVVDTKGHCNVTERKRLQKRVKRLVNDAVFLGIGPQQLHALINSELHHLKEAGK